MNFITVNDYETLSRMAADIICSVVKENQSAVLGLATGSSPLGTYAEIVKRNAAGEIDLSQVTSVNLDEYIGLGEENDQSYRYFMNKNLFEKVNIDIKNTHVPSGLSSNPSAECENYDKYIESLGGTDIQLLGIGLDGHIGFNEPDDHFTKETHVVSLDPSTIKANARFFESEDDVPRYAITMGMGAIMSSKKILLVANGHSKKEILEKAFYGPITPLVPASILQLHPDVTVIFSEN